MDMGKELEIPVLILEQYAKIATDITHIKERIKMCTHKKTSIALLEKCY